MTPELTKTRFRGQRRVYQCWTGLESEYEFSVMAVRRAYHARRVRHRYVRLVDMIYHSNQALPYSQSIMWSITACIDQEMSRQRDERFPSEPNPRPPSRPHCLGTR